MKKKNINKLLYIFIILISILEISNFNSNLNYIKKDSSTLESHSSSIINDNYIINDKILSLKKIKVIKLYPNTKNNKVLINYLFLNKIINYIEINFYNNDYSNQKCYFSNKIKKKLFLNKDDF